MKWFVSYLNASYKKRVPKGQWEKKPFNPVLGEQWHMQWADVHGCGETDVLCEQVSHHPPITAFHIKNEKAGVVLKGHSGQKTRISNATLVCDQPGRELLTLPSRNNESYLFTSPSLTVRGLWYAAPYVELIGTTYIQASTGYYATVEYSSRGWISGEKNHFKCLIRKNSAGPKDYLYKIEGQWSGKSFITDYKTRVSQPFIDTADFKPAIAKVKPIEEMGEMETRRIWQKVSEAIRKNDMTTASREKSIIENKKRAEKKEREEEGVAWKPLYFKWEEDEPTVTKLQQQLAPVLKHTSKYDMASYSQKGLWVFHEPPKKKETTTEGSVAAAAAAAATTTTTTTDNTKKKQDEDDTQSS
ncbi:hypothetical protein BDF20DRAFT_216486 [Mycotypha africana]|uniref:uncharacterized protein n=1 Tax=Mycotypha africana TaxID=64632 RepID=UPI0023015A57|nr:uncharacterized protein BDF20DRAFT_216486 [Mycotypha africana]KAI8967829.1 hypothetical protein BDF20DRAFT_216486 [Mycotypha africana]